MLKSILENKTEFDYKLDYIPVASTFTNLYYLLQKCTYPTPPLETTDRHYELLQSKSFIRCIILLVPILGNITIGVGDFLSDAKPIQLQLIKAGLISLPSVSLRLQEDHDILRAAIEKNPSEIRFVINPDSACWIFTVSAYSNKKPSLNDIHPFLKNNYDVICSAVQGDSDNLRYVTDPQIAVKLFQNGFKARWNEYLTTDKLHESLKNNYNVLKAAVSKYPENLQYILDVSVVEKLWTENIISPRLWQTHKQLQTNPRLLQIALDKDPVNHIRFIKDKAGFLSFFANRTSTDETMLSCCYTRLAKEKIEKEVVTAAIKKNPKELRCIYDRTLAEYLFQQKDIPTSLKHLHHSLKNNEKILQAAITKDPTEIRFIENKEFILALLKDPRRSITLEDLYPSLKNDNDVIDAALKKDPSNLRFIQNSGFVIGLFAAIEEYAQGSRLSSILKTKPISITLKDVHPSFKENDDVIRAAYQADKKNIQYAGFASIITFLHHTPDALQHIEDKDIILTIFAERYNLPEFTLNDIHESLRDDADIKYLAESKGPKLHNEEGTSKKLPPTDSKTSSPGIVAKAITALDAKVQEITAPEETKVTSETLFGDNLV